MLLVGLTVLWRVLNGSPLGIPLCFRPHTCYSPPTLYQFRPFSVPRYVMSLHTSLYISTLPWKCAFYYRMLLWASHLADRLQVTSVSLCPLQIFAPSICLKRGKRIPTALYFVLLLSPPFLSSHLLSFLPLLSSVVLLFLRQDPADALRELENRSLIPPMFHFALKTGYFLAIPFHLPIHTG